MSQSLFCFRCRSSSPSAKIRVKSIRSRLSWQPSYLMMSLFGFAGRRFPRMTASQTCSGGRLSSTWSGFERAHCRETVCRHAENEPLDPACFEWLDCSDFQRKTDAPEFRCSSSWISWYIATHSRNSRKSDSCGSQTAGYDLPGCWVSCWPGRELCPRYRSPSRTRRRLQGPPVLIWVDYWSRTWPWISQASETRQSSQDRFLNLHSIENRSVDSMSCFCSSIPLAEARWATPASNYEYRSWTEHWYSNFWSCLSCHWLLGIVWPDSLLLMNLRCPCCSCEDSGLGLCCYSAECWRFSGWCLQQNCVVTVPTEYSATRRAAHFYFETIWKSPPTSYFGFRSLPFYLFEGQRVGNWAGCRWGLALWVAIAWESSAHSYTPAGPKSDLLPQSPARLFPPADSTSCCFCSQCWRFH